MEAIQRKIQSRLHTCSAGSIAVGVSGYRYTYVQARRTWRTRGIIVIRIATCLPDVHVVGFWSPAIPTPTWRLDGDKRPRGRRYGWTRVYVRFQRDPRARSLVSESKSTFECARKHSKINDLCDTRRERVRADRQPVSQAACLALPCHALPCLAMHCLALPWLALPWLALPWFALPANRRWRLWPRGNRGGIALCHFSVSRSEHCIRISPSRSGEPSYETIDPIPWIPHHFKRRPPRPIGGDRGRGTSAGKYMSARLVSMSYKERLVFFCLACSAHYIRIIFNLRDEIIAPRRLR